MSVGGGAVVEGIYVALLQKERRHLEQHAVDPRWAFTPRGRAGDEAPLRWRTSRRKLDALEDGEAITLQGRQIWLLLPVSRRRRADALAWFTITPDDRLTPASPPAP